MFSELSNITADTGLSFSDEHTALYGEKHGFGVTVSDADGRYVIDIFCDSPSEHGDDIFPAVSRLGESLPKNTLISQSCGTGTITVTLDRSMLLQENVIYLIEFLDKLTGELEALGLTGRQYRFFAAPKRETASVSADGIRIKLGFDLRSVLGIAAALIGAAAMIVISVLLVDVRAESAAFGLAFEVSAYILSGATAAVVFADYRFPARKLDACGIIVCPILTVAAVILSGFGAGVKAAAQAAGVSFMQALRDFPAYLAENEEIDKFVMGFITRGVIFAAAVSIGICLLYFSRHPDETVRSEKIVPRDGDQSGKRGS